MKPHPPQPKVCVRYLANGLRCTTRTLRRDGWCGTCDGYTTPQPPNETTFKPPAINLARQAVMPPLDPDEAHEISVTRSAINDFTRRHGSSPAEAEAQIRSLVEDALIQARWGYVRKNGSWALGVDQMRFSVVISADMEAVTAYDTVHTERTWAQVNAGVASRISKTRNRTPTWIRDAISAALNGILVPHEAHIDPAAVLRYAKLTGMQPISQDDLSSLRPALDAVLKALAAWDGSSKLLDPERPGALWVVHNSLPGKPPRVAFYVSADRAKP